MILEFNLFYFCTHFWEFIGALSISTQMVGCFHPYRFDILSVQDCHWHNNVIVAAQATDLWHCLLVELVLCIGHHLGNKWLRYFYWQQINKCSILHPKKIIIIT